MSGRNRKVRVWGRLRPTSNFSHENVEVLPDNKGINIHMRRDPKKGVVNNQILDWSFKLDGIFNNADQEVVYNTVTSDVVSSSLEGYNGTLMCYGQTGAGKTFTMTGATESYRHRGLIPRAISQLYRQIEDRLEYSITVRVSYMEIYNEQMFDLLGTFPEGHWSNKDINCSPDPMVISENQGGVFVKGLSCHLAQNEEEALNLLFEGETNRSIAAHSLNKVSSRSHCIFTVYIESRSRVQSNAKYTVSKLNFVDLAGSERLSKTKSEGKTKEEAMYINKSLSFLEQVVIALASKSREHVPFRQSKLTHFLKDSIGGNCNTVLIANMWGEKPQMEETVSTLRFATRMMCVASEPAVNEIYDPALLVKKLQKEICHLKSELAMHDTLKSQTNRSMISYDPLSEQQKYEIRTQVRRFLEGSLDEIDIVNLRQIVGCFGTFKDLYQDMEKEMEAKLREKYMLIDKTDPNSIAAAQQAGVPIADDGSYVGDLEGGGFGVGTAPKSAKGDTASVVQLRKKERERERKRGSRGANSPIAGKPASSPSQSIRGERKADSPPTPVGERVEKDQEGSASPVSSTGNLSRADRSQRPRPAVEEPESGDPEERVDLEPQKRPDTPPTRSAAFEEFKSDRGSEINRILIDNKEYLATSKKNYSELAKQMNTLKMNIDTSRQRLDELKLLRESEGPILNEDGDIVISEDEFKEITKLRELKTNYRTKRDDLAKTESEVKYCQKLVDQCRLKLIQEFDNWYSESFLSATDDNQTSLGVGTGARPGVMLPITSLTNEDEQEKFERLQLELMMNNPESAAFYNAQMRTTRRKIYGQASNQPQPAFRRQAGTPTMTFRNQPPGLMQVQY